jgi:hypothetical protein
MDVVDAIQEGDEIETVSIKRVGDRAKTFSPATYFTDKDRKEVD